MIQDDPSRSELIRSDFCTCLLKCQKSGKCASGFLNIFMLSLSRAGVEFTHHICFHEKCLNYAIFYDSEIFKGMNHNLDLHVLSKRVDHCESIKTNNQGVIFLSIFFQGSFLGSPFESPLG